MILDMQLESLLTEPSAPMLWTELQGSMSRLPLSPAVLWGINVLAAVASMMLREDGDGPEYGPFAQFSGGRTRIPVDLSEDELSFLRSVASRLPHDELAARSADIVWLRSGSRREDHHLAVLAVERRLRQSITDESWHSGVSVSVARGVAMAKALGRRDDLVALRDKILDSARTSTDAPFKISLIRFLDTHELLGDASEILDAIQPAIDASEDRHLRRTGLELKRSLLTRLQRHEESASASRSIAEDWIAEASEREALVAASFLENALQMLRSIPRRWRDSQVNAHLASLPARIRKAGEDGLASMQVVTTDPIDITGAIQQTVSAVGGKTFEDALVQLCILAPPDRFESARKTSEDLASTSISALFGHVTLGVDGRKTDSSGVKNPYGLPHSVWHLMHQNFALRVVGISAAVLYPGLDVIRMEHNVGASTFEYLVSRCAFVPPKSKSLFTRGLTYGYRGNYTTAAHLLVPQLEASIRFHLREAGVDTDRLDQHTAISNEVGLSTLMKAAEVERLLGLNLAWEIRALLSGPGGLNLRNAVAHGLASDEELSGPAGLYVWWLALRLVFTDFWNSERSQVPEESGPSQDAHSEESD